MIISTTKINKQLLIFFFVSHVDLIVSIEKNELTIERFWTSIFLNFWVVKNAFVKNISKSCKKMKFDWFLNHASTKSQKIIFIHSNNFDSQYRCWHCWKCWMKMMIWLNRFFSEFSWNRAELKISKFANKNNAKNDKLIVDIFIDSYVNLIASIKKYELTTNFFACCSRLCWRNISLKLNVCLQCRHDVDNFFVDFDVISNAKNWKVERFNKMTSSNVNANSFIDFWIANKTNDLCETNDVFLILHIKLTALIEK